MELEVTRAETDSIEDVETAKYAVGLPTAYKHLAATGTSSMLGPITRETRGRREYKVFREAVKQAVEDEPNVTAERLSDHVLVGYRLRRTATKMDIRDVVAYRDRDLSHLLH